MEDNDSQELIEDHYEEEVSVQSPGTPASTIYTNYKRRRSSSLWNKFTILNESKGIAECDICGVKLSFRSSVSNLKKHIIRKHNYDPSTRIYRPNLFKEKQRVIKRKKSPVELDNLGALIQSGGIIGEEVDLANVDETEGPQVQVVEESIVFRSDGDIHNYCVIEDPHTLLKQHELQGKKPEPTRHRTVNESDEMKKSCILDLQLECLEMKKYTMQMEALVLEQQLNLPRSLYTQSLREVDVWTRGTQTEVGGDNTKVFYVSDKAGESQGAHLFTFRGSIHQ